jgi:hypothetical protein
MPTSFTQGRHAAEFILSEAPGWRSRENVIVTGAAALGAGAVLGMILASGITQEFSGTGNGVLTPDATTPLLAGVQEGAYRVVCLEPGSNVGTFAVYDPQGVHLGNHVVAGSAFANQIKFAIADGATDFVAGDTFTLWVRGGSASAVTGTGNGTLTLYATREPAQPGVYSLVCTAAAANGGTFSVTAPDGTVLAPATVGTRYVDGGLEFRINDGGTDFIVGDSFAITVARGKMKACDSAATDGSGIPAGILIAAVDASAADAKGAALVRDAEVTFAELTWASAMDASEKQTARLALAGRGIVCR